MKRPNGVILDSPSILADCSSAATDVPPCKVNECGYFHRDCRDEFALGTMTERCLDAVTLNVVNGIKDMLDDEARPVDGCDEAEMAVLGVADEHCKDPPLPGRATGEDEEMKLEGCFDKRIARLEPVADKRERIMLSIDQMMRELRGHEAALILLKRMRLSQLMFNWQGKPPAIGASSTDVKQGQLSKPSGVRCIPVPSFFDANSVHNATTDPRYSVRVRKGETKSRGGNGVRRCETVQVMGSSENPRWKADDQLNESHPDVSKLNGPEHRLLGGGGEDFNQSTHQVFSGATRNGSVKGSNGMCQATQRYNASNARMGTSGQHGMDRNLQLMSVLMESIQRTVDDFLHSFRHYTELSLSSRIHSASNGTFLAFMPCNAVNFVPSVANPEFTMLIGLEEVCHRIENRLVVSRGGGTTEVEPKTCQTPNINQCSKCMSYSSPFFFDLTDSPSSSSDRPPICCGNCLRTMRLEQLAGSQFRKYQSILDGHKEAERQEAANKQWKLVAEKRPAAERCDDHKCKTRSPQHHYCPRTQRNECSDPPTPRRGQPKQVNDLDLKRPANGVFPSPLSFPSSHLSPEQLQQCHAEWLRQAAFLQTATPNDHHFQAESAPLFSNAVAAAAALAAMTATHHSAIAQSGLAQSPLGSFPIPGIISSPGNFHLRSDPPSDRQARQVESTNDIQDEDCGAALNLTTTKHDKLCGRGGA